MNEGPTGSRSRVVPIATEDVIPVDGRYVVLSGQRHVPIVHLSSIVGLEDDARQGRPNSHPMAVVMTDGLQQVAFLVDEIVGYEEVVAKHLGERLERLRFISGASVLPNGNLALIVNASELVSAALEAPGDHALLHEAVDGEEMRGRLLVVEDSATTRMLAVSVLQTAGYSVEAAVDGLEAWSVLEESAIDLVVTDLEMPRLDGVELTRKMRSTPRTRDIPVILLTAREAEEDKLRGLQAGADAYLRKSTFDQQALLEMIRRLLP